MRASCLMEDGVVRGVYGVSSVHVAGAQEGGVAGAQQLGLVRRRVTPQHCIAVHVVRVVGRAADVVSCGRAVGTAVWQTPEQFP